MTAAPIWDDDDMPEGWERRAAEIKAEQSRDVGVFSRLYLCDWKEQIRRDATAQQLGFHWDDRTGRYVQ